MAAGKTVRPSFRSLRMFSSNPSVNIRKMMPRLDSTLMLSSLLINRLLKNFIRISEPATM